MTPQRRPLIARPVSGVQTVCLVYFAYPVTPGEPDTTPAWMKAFMTAGLTTDIWSYVGRPGSGTREWCFEPFQIRTRVEIARAFELEMGYGYRLSAFLTDTVHRLERLT